MEGRQVALGALVVDQADHRGAHLGASGGGGRGVGVPAGVAGAGAGSGGEADHCRGGQRQERGWAA